MHVIILVFLLSHVPASLGEVERAYIDTALQALNMRESDLSFEKKRTDPDSFRLAIVDRFMDRPLELPGYADSCEQVVLYAGSDPFKLLMFTARTLEFIDENTSEKDIKRQILKLKDSPEMPSEFLGIREDSLREGLELLYASMLLAGKLLDKAFAGLTEGERDTLLYEALEIWSDSNDSTDDTLAGVLLREKGIKLDTTWEVKEESILGMARKVDMESLLKAGLAVACGLKLALPYIEVYKNRKVTQLNFLSPLGPVRVGSQKGDRYEGDYAIIFDPGGDDFYHGRCAGAIGDSGFMTVSVLIDLSGDDVYRSMKGISHGSGYMGVGLLFDAEGNDLYEGQANSIATGLFGVGILMDLTGDDSYISSFFSQGAGNFGVGILYDGDGNDSYRAHDWTQGFGSVWGYGLLVDMGGNDSYYAGGRYIHRPLHSDLYRSLAQGFATGWRDDASGGVGFLYDRTGNDSYYCEIYGQGSSYWYSLGMLIDAAGNDSYNAAQYAQGAGIHLTAAILIDRKGKDHYFARHGPSQGEGHDFAVGILIDKEGEDFYEVGGGEGIGLNNSVGIFIDSQGCDTYSMRGNGQGWSNWSRGTIGVGIFLDLGGSDIYPEGYNARNSSIWTSGTCGVGIDTEVSE